MTFTSCSDEAFDVDSVNKQTILASIHGQAEPPVRV